MYIEKTTAAERLIIRGAVDGSFVYVMRARRLLMRVLAEHFEDRRQKNISESDAEDVRDILEAVNDALWWAETEYALTVGDESAPGCDSCYKGAERAALVRDVERLRNKLPYELRTVAEGLDDEKALPILQETLKSKGEMMEVHT